jgi:hypothetical protein
MSIIHSMNTLLSTARNVHAIHYVSQVAYSLVRQSFTSVATDLLLLYVNINDYRWNRIRGFRIIGYYFYY